MNVRQTKFVAEYLKSGNATQSAIKAGYSQKSAKVIGRQLLSRDDIQAELQKQQGKIINNAGYSVEKSFMMLEKAQDMAINRMVNGSPMPDIGNFIKAEELKGKLMGLYIDRKEIGGLDTQPLEVKIIAGK